MDLTPIEKEEILLAIMGRIEMIIATLEADRLGTHSEYWLDKLESCNTIYRKMMGCNATKYDDYKYRRKQMEVAE